jgi:hypothetical protein
MLAVVFKEIPVKTSKKTSLIKLINRKNLKYALFLKFLLLKCLLIAKAVLSSGFTSLINILIGEQI